MTVGILCGQFSRVDNVNRYTEVDIRRDWRIEEDGFLHRCDWV